MASETLPGKQPVTILAGPYGHPLHPLLVTVPIGAWVASVVFDIASQIVDDPAALAQGAGWLVGLGILGALAAALVGFLDLLAIPTGTRAFRVALLHMSTNLVVVAVFAVSLVMRWPVSDATEAVTAGPMAVSTVGLVLLGVGGWLGGVLSFGYGVRVADERAQSRAFQRAEGAR
jgi:uncharacterized membrane protein